MTSSRPRQDPPLGEPPNSDPFAVHREIGRNSLSPELLQWSAEVRPSPGIFVTGVMVRSGTQFVSNLLGLHPDVVRHPRKIWELPLVRRVPGLQRVTQRFFHDYRFNRDRLGDNDLMGLLGAGMLAYLQAAVPPGKRILLTHPGAHYLDYFRAWFPHEHSLLLMRDGRDVVASADRTWPKWGFEKAARRWDEAARMMLRTRAFWEREHERFHYCTYEDAVTDPDGFVRRACVAFELNPDTYPYDAIRRDLRVKGSSSFDGVSEGKWEIRRAGDDFKPVGRWRDWSGDQKRIFKDVAGRSLIDCGYASDLSW